MIASSVCDYSIISSCGHDYLVVLMTTPLWGTADAEIKIPSVEENPELEGSLVKAWSKSE